jgi:hypothetical protein
MKRQIPGLHAVQQKQDDTLEGAFLARVDRVFFRWHPQRPFYALRFVIREPEGQRGRSFNGRLYCTPKAIWRLRWFLRDFGYDQELMGRDEVDEKALLSLQGVVRISHPTLNGHSFLNLSGFAPASEWEEIAASRGSHQEVSRDL